jgi:hypothetical protein
MDEQQPKTFTIEEVNALAAQQAEARKLEQASGAWMLLLTIALIGATLLLIGIEILWGTGWLLLAAGLLCLAFAAVLLRGLKHG